jgi:Sodium/hydrogen exchanger family
MCAVAYVAHLLIPGLPWATAFVLGAIVSPTDPVAATTIMRRLDAPRRLISGIEGEGLFNDAIALVAYRAVVGAVVGGGFSLIEAGWKFVVSAVAGVVIGIAVGVVAAATRKRITDAQVSVNPRLCVRRRGGGVRQGIRAGGRRGSGSTSAPAWRPPTGSCTRWSRPRSALPTTRSAIRPGSRPETVLPRHRLDRTGFGLAPELDEGVRRTVEYFRQALSSTGT